MCKLSVKTVSLLAFFVTALCGPVVVLAQTYPTKPIKLIVPFPPGGALDSVARAMVDPLKERLGQPVIIDNRPGAGARLATEVVVRSPGDGYTILITTPASTTVAPALIPNLTYSPTIDLIPIARVSEIVNVMLVPEGRNIKTVQEFINWAKGKKGGILFGTSGAGSADHLAGEFFKQIKNLPMEAIHYKGGGPAMIDLAAERLDVSFATYAAASSVLQSGKIRAIAVTTPKRQGMLPSLPTIGETVKDFGVSNWAGIFVPKNTPQAIVDRLFKEFVAVSNLPEVRKRQNLAGLEISLSASTEEFSSSLKLETTRWNKIIKEANIKVE